MCGADNDSADGRPRVRLVLLGGFLGAGKTTALLRLARHHADRGRRVAIITNDQGEGLVDTETFRSAGFVTEEVPAGCFCCKFDELIAAAGRLEDGHRPDVLLAEPVGSCTDLVSTVLNPLRKLYADRFSVAPYVTLLDPERAGQALGGGPGGFSAKVTYIYKMQQNEADVVAINKVDLLGAERLDELTGWVRRSFPKAEVMAVSARTGEGFERLAERLEAGGPAGAPGVDVDYDLYAEGEARLGWLNATLSLRAAGGFDSDRFLLDLAEAIRISLAGASAEPAHAKIILRSGESVAIANVVSGSRTAELSKSAGVRLAEANLVVNARVEAASSLLRNRVESAVADATRRHGVEASFESLESFAPARPEPTMRHG